MITPRQAATRVKRGVELLDTVRPNWVKNINLKTFDLGNGDMCVLGQVYGGFLTGLQKLAKVHIPNGIKLQTEAQRLAERSDCDCSICRASDSNSEPELDDQYYGFNIPYEYRGNDSENEAFELLGQQWVKVITRRKTEFKDASRFAA